MARDIEVKVRFNTDEYLAFRHVAEDEGLSQGSLLRMLAKHKIREVAMKQFSSDEQENETPATRPGRAYDSTVNPVSLIKGAL